MSKLDTALHFAIDAHAGMIRKGNKAPYILHPLEVVTIAATMTNDEDILCAAILHDVVEDTPHTLDELRELFGVRVADLVASETEDKLRGRPASETWLERKRGHLEQLRGASDSGVKILWIADKLANMRSFAQLYKTEGDAMWQHFHQHDPALHAWYHRSIADATEDLAHTDAWKEYTHLIEIVFKGVE